MKLRHGLFAAMATAITVTATPILAETYPDHPVRWIVPFGPGGSSSIFARLVADKLSENLGQQFVIENRGGAGGNIGVAAAANAEPDGYTLVLGVTSTHGINAHIYPDMPFDPLADFEPVAFLAWTPNIMVVNPDKVKATTVAEFIEEAKAAERPMNMASSGVGTSIHLAGEMFMLETGVKMTHIPYKGSAPAITDLVAGQVDIDFDNLPSSIEQVRAGNLRALAVTSATRSFALPDVPTLQEAGLDGFDATGWWTLSAPKGTPPEIIAKLNAEVNKILQTQEIQDRFATFGAETRIMTPDETRAFITKEYEKWGAVVKAANVTLQ
ncbi:Bug family tripartite tricarboxylate transporter substrate binding protein [Arenibacterium halophilum]|uniref:Tripartite tricarboxylate transporter substrate binding protein n=1 Tax=Arenibacterium halophilum TaxID=2583821 RepID=A0ABY2WZC0_9RHOB|nr:tripartite tricarboxylate transporter substrate binding protein [Arenibacterium halophilum]TMV08291.1 tripartite tricarboxylate transporter substrate binding protein [Arenibacterium halophilum]